MNMNCIYGVIINYKIFQTPLARLGISIDMFFVQILCKNNNFIYTNLHTILIMNKLEIKRIKRKIQDKISNSMKKIEKK